MGQDSLDELRALIDACDENELEELRGLLGKRLYSLQGVRLRREMKGFRPGSRVSFEYWGEWFMGEVLWLNRKTVTVERSTDSKRFRVAPSRLKSP